VLAAARASRSCHEQSAEPAQSERLIWAAIVCTDSKSPASCSEPGLDDIVRPSPQDDARISSFSGSVSVPPELVRVSEGGVKYSDRVHDCSCWLWVLVVGCRSKSRTTEQLQPTTNTHK